MGIRVHIRLRLNLVVLLRSLPIGCFHNKTKCVLGVSQEQLRESESLKQNIKVTLLNRVSAALQASRLQLVNQTPP